MDGPTLPGAFITQADGSLKLNTDYFTSAEVTKSDPQVVTYTINPKAVWSDGTPITWEDIASMANAQSGKDTRYKIAAPCGIEAGETIVTLLPGRDHLVAQPEVQS